MENHLDIQCVVFDLGGVLIELDGPPVSPEHTPMTEIEIWQHWLKSSAVRDFESGACDHHEFADQLINEFRLNQSRSQFLKNFEQWPLGFYPESLGIVEALYGKTQIACLSNTNDLHWQRFKAESPIYDMMDHLLFSFEMGLIKPDPEMFHAAQERLGLPANRLLFLDDNQTNVDAAKAHGWHASTTKGPAEVTACLKHYRLL